jgi:hypothetical protein
MSYVPNATASFSRETTYASSTRPFFIPTGDIVIDGSGNTVFPANVEIDGGLIVADSIQTDQSISAAGNISALTGSVTAASLSASTTNGTTSILTDGLGNASIVTESGAGGNGQAYHDLKTAKPIAGTFNFRRLVDSNGDCYLQNDPPGGPTRQQMYWDAPGANMLFNFGATTGLIVKPNYIEAPGLVSVYGQNTNIDVNATTTIFQLTAAQFGSFAAQVPVTLNFFPGDLATAYAVTYILNVGKLAGNLGFYVENQAIADAALPAGWTLSASGSGTPTITISVTTGVTPIGTGGQRCNYTATFIGAGTV